MPALDRQQGRLDPAHVAQKETPHQGQGAKPTNQSNSEGNTTKAQRQRLLATLLSHGTITTLQARHDLDVLHPAARVLELRADGWNIVTIWKHDDTGQASRHRVACYVYQRGAL
jgi:hypothetical protein